MSRCKCLKTLLHIMMSWLTVALTRICWPFQADQAINTIHLTDNANIAYELTEVRTGHGLKPIYRTGKAPTATLDAVKDEMKRVLQLALGKDGEEKRKNIEMMKDDVNQLWKEDGLARKEFESFLEDTA